MIEFLNSRRMILIVVILILISLIVVILEDLLADNVDKPSPHRLNKLNKDLNDLNINKSQLSLMSDENTRTNSKCWLIEDFETITDCIACTQYEKVSRHLIACIPNGFKQRIKCLTFGSVYRSCDKSNANFWVFEFSMIFFSTISCLCVYKRQKYLDRITFERIQRQIASGV
jgi:hypothetical protein